MATVRRPSIHSNPHSQSVPILIGCIDISPYENCGAARGLDRPSVPPFILRSKRSASEIPSQKSNRENVESIHMPITLGFYSTLRCG